MTANRRSAPVPSPAAEARQAPRLQVPAMYTLLRVRPQGEARYRWTGYVYDVSATGMRFELDAALVTGSVVEVRAMLPGHETLTFTASGRIVRHHDEASEPGPIRMGLAFERFRTAQDSRRLADYLERSDLRAAA